MRQVIRVIKTPVTLIILLAMLGYGAMWGYQHVTMPDSRRAETCVMTDVGANLTPEKVTVRVLNGGESGGLAKTVAGDLRIRGFHVVYYNNSDERVPNTIVIGNSVDDPEVKLMLGFFTGSTARGDGRADHVVDVILGDKSPQVKNPAMSVPVNGPVCLPPIAPPTASATPSPTPTASKKK